MNVQIIPATSQRYRQAVALIEQTGLPVSDLDNESVSLFGVVESRLLTGVIGLEVLGEYGLLRSLVVEPGFRGQAFAQRLCEAVFRYAADQSLVALYLLTVDAADYFGRFNFKIVPRDKVPNPIRASSQYSDLCLGSAIVMRRPV